MLGQRGRSRVANGLERAHLLGTAECVRRHWLTVRASDVQQLSPGRHPLPPRRLRLLVDGRSADADRFLRIGGAMFDSIHDAAAGMGAQVEEMQSVLDFGCGSGRVARHWSSVEGPELHGCDYNPELVAWCAANLPFMVARRNALAPPTPYRESSFDLIYALSVFSHLTEPLQRAWVTELRRLLRPGGLLLISVLGHHVQERLGGGERERFERGELVVQRPRMAGRNLCTAYHPRSYVERGLLAEFADLREFRLGAPRMPLMQDAYVARR
jgi:SAM-dependent methyltransferase